jgi:hypothetical protein
MLKKELIEEVLVHSDLEEELSGECDEYVFTDMVVREAKCEADSSSDCSESDSLPQEHAKCAKTSQDQSCLETRAVVYSISSQRS